MMAAQGSDMFFSAWFALLVFFKIVVTGSKSGMYPNVFDILLNNITIKSC